MIWTLLFAITIAQGLFLISLIVVRGSKNPLASRLIIAIIVPMILTNFGYMVTRTDLVNYIPQFFGIPFGMMFLFGPLLYFYSKSVIDKTFHWKKKYWLHFIPYFIYFLTALPILLADRTFWIWYINNFLAGNQSIRWVEKLTFAVQDLHLLIYLVITTRWIRSIKKTDQNGRYMIPVSSRVRWVTALTYCLFLFLITVCSLYALIMIHGKYNPVTNYIYTLISSGIIYFIAYKMVLNPELISPGFKQKYQAYMSFIGEDGEKYLQKLKALMDKDKIFMDPDLNLSLLAKNIGLPSHQVSKLINEKFGKSFNDYINEYRVQEFISRIGEVQNKSYTIYGIALDVGFNSKSSFNAAFKKFTGRNPSNYKIS